MSNSKYRVAVGACGLCLLIAACANESRPDIDGTPEGGAGGDAEGGEGGNAAEGGGGGTLSSAGGAPLSSGGNAGSNVAGQGGVSAGNAGGMSGSIGNAGGKPGPVAMGGQAGGTTTPASKCEAPACDDFEKYGAGTRPGAPWSEFEVSATGGLGVDATRAFSGTKSMKFTMSPGEDMAARMRHAGSGFVPGKEVFMRAMMFLEKPITGQGVFHWNLMRTEGNDTIVAGGNGSGKTFQNFGGHGRDCYVHGGNAMPTGKWVCIEYHVNGQSNVAEIMLNGVLDDFTQVINGDALPGLSGCLSPPGNKWDIPEPKVIRFGFTMHHQLDRAVTMWLDDIAVSNQRIGCPSQK